MRARFLRTTTIAAIGAALAWAPLATAQSDPTAATVEPPARQVPPEGGIEGGAPPNDALPGDTGAAAPGQSAVPGAAGVSPAARASNMQPPGTVLSTDMTGATVQTTRGEDVATLSDLVVAPDGRVAGAIVTVGGVLGVGGKEVIVAWEDLRLGTDGTTITVAMSERQLEQAPAFQPLPKQSEASGATSASQQ